PAGPLHALRALASAGVGLGVLAAHRQAATVTQAAVAGDVLEAFDVLRALAPQIALDGQAVVDRVAELGHLVLGEVADVGVGADADVLQQLVGRRAPDPVDVGQPDLRTLV